MSKQGTKHHSGRYNFAKASWGQKLFDWSRQDDVGKAMGDDINSVFDAVANYDPTKDEKRPYRYVFWLCHFAIKDNIKPEDVYKIKDNLETFIRVRKLLPEDKRDISRIASARELDTLVDPYRDVEVKSLNDLKREEREQILNETLFLYEGEDGKILIPTTQRACQFWGQGTKWCISSTSPDHLHHFPNYNKKGPIVIYLTNETGYRIVMKDGEETQIPYQIKYAGHKEHLLTDVTDDVVKQETAKSFQDLVQNSGQLDFCIRYGGIRPIHFPPHRFSEEMLFDKINKGEIKLGHIHEEERTEKICIAAITQHKREFDYVPKDKYTEAIILSAMKQDAYALRSIPENKCTEAIYLAAVTRSGCVLACVPENKRTEDICFAAIRQDGHAFKNVPENMRTETIKRVALDTLIGSYNKLKSFGFKLESVTNFINIYNLQNILTDEERQIFSFSHEPRDRHPRHSTLHQVFAP